MMNTITKHNAIILGIYAGLLGMAHGVFEILQGNTLTNGISINAIGAPCQTDAIWHACLPAMTLLPTFLAAGITTIIVSLAVVIWTGLFIHKKHAGKVLMFLSILMLLAGGGFIPTFTGLMAGMAGSKITSNLPFFDKLLSNKHFQWLPRLWLWAILLYFTWAIGGWILGTTFNQVMIDLNFLLFFVFDLGLPIFIIMTGFARDAQTRIALQ